MNADQATKCTYIYFTMSTTCVARGQISHAHSVPTTYKNTEKPTDCADLS